jgi:hypothetical protein
MEENAHFFLACGRVQSPPGDPTLRKDGFKISGPVGSFRFGRRGLELLTSLCESVQTILHTCNPAVSVAFETGSPPCLATGARQSGPLSFAVLAYS